MIWAVLDTNVLISGFMSEAGPPGVILDRALNGRFQIVTSKALLDELARKVASPKLSRYFDDPGGLVVLVSAVAIVVEPRTQVRIATDPDDDRLLEASIESGADFLVTGDKKSGLLDLGALEGTQIVTPKGFVAELDGVLDT